jgi:recombination protein RecT
MSNVATQNNPVAAFSGFMDKFKPQLALAIPKHLSADRMSRLALTAFSTNSALQNCDPKSIAASIMTAGQLGLEPGVNGQGYLIPYKTTCTFVPGWKGLVDLVSRSGRGTVYTGVIFKDQEYTFVDGARRDLIIHNETDLDDPEDITHAYAIGWVKDASLPIIELWTVAKIRKHRDKYNKVGTKHYSFRDWEMYARKIPLLQVLKYMPQSIEMSNAITVSHASESGRAVTIENGIVLDNNPEPQDEQKQCYPEDDFTRNFPGWKKLIAEGKKTAQQVIAMANSKAPLTDDQQLKIVECRGPVAQSNAPISVTYAQVSDKLNKATDLDLLDAAADLIGEVADQQQRAELGEIYNQRKAALSA